MVNIEWECKAYYNGKAFSHEAPLNQTSLF